MRRVWRAISISASLCLALLATGWTVPRTESAQSGRIPRTRVPLMDRLSRKTTVWFQSASKACTVSGVVDLTEWKRIHPSRTLHYAVANTRLVFADTEQRREGDDASTVMVTEQERQRAQGGRSSSTDTTSRLAGGVAGERQQSGSISRNLSLRIAATAMAMLGKAYAWGGTKPTTGFDCSGLVEYVFSRVGISLPRTTWQQFAVGRPIPVRSLRPGDLLFFSTYASGPTHVGIYVGNNRFVNALNPGTGVILSSLHDPYFATRLIGARSVTSDAAANG